MKIIKIFVLFAFISSCHLRENNKLIRSSEEYDIARLSNSYIFDGYNEPEIRIILNKVNNSKINFTNVTVDTSLDIKIEFSKQFEDKSLKKKLDDKKTTDEEKEKILKKIQENNKKQEIILRIINFNKDRNVQLLNYQYGLFLTYFAKNIKVNIPKGIISKNIINKKLNRLDNEIEIQY